jgi:DNA replication protein DnaC
LNSSSGDGAGEAQRVELICPKHGKYSAWRGAAESAGLNDCPRCIDEQQAERDREGREKAERQARQMRQTKLRKLIEQAGIPAEFEASSLDTYRVTSAGQQLAVTICRAYASSWEDQYRKGGSLVLTGLTGTGKTHLACAIANAIITAHLCTVAFGTVSDYSREIRSTYGRSRGERSELQVMQALREVDLLIADDIGAQDGSDFEMKMLYDLIDGRWRAKRPIIVTSNLNNAELQKFIGTRLMDRLRDRGTVIAFDWASHRGQVGAA